MNQSLPYWTGDASHRGNGGTSSPSRWLVMRDIGIFHQLASRLGLNDLANQRHTIGRVAKEFRNILGRARSLLM
jgi:hypothetical protein